MVSELRARASLRALALVGAIVVQAVIGAVTASAGGGEDFVLAPGTRISHPKIDGALLAGRPDAHAFGQIAAVTDAASVDVAVTSTTVAATVELLRGLGADVQATYRDRIQARMPAFALEEAAASPSVVRIDAPDTFMTYAVTSEGVAAANAAAWHDAGLRGTGVKIGVIDGGFAGYQTSQQLGDLPPNVVIVDHCGGQVAVSKHGTAVAEIVHDMAPQAALHLICISSPIGMGAAKDYAIAQGIKIVNMSGGFFGTSRGDGRGGPATPEGIAASARNAGILWVAASSNAGRSHWSGQFTSADGDTFHDFAPGDEGNTFLLPSAATVCIYLKWDEWPSAASDYDVYLYRGAETTPVAGSARDSTIAPTAPVERTCYTNTGASQSFAVAIVRISGSGSPRLDLFDGTGIATFEYGNAAGSLAEPATSPDVLAVGAVCWQGSLLFLPGGQGPTIDGRIKPDIAASTVVSTASFGSASGCSSGFAGTSSASPHVAGAAALVAQANPSFTPAQIQATLEQRATDLGAPGKDNQFGSGVLQLGAAPAPAAAAPPVVAPPPTYTVYLPNITRMLGGRYGWHTPFIVQNVGTASTSLSVKFYRFADGALVATRTATVLPGRSFVGSPNDEADLPENSQFSVVITSTSAPVVAVVNEHQGGPGITPEALSYSGFSAGSTKVNLPLVSKMAGGWLTTMIMQNIGGATTTVTGTFVRLDGTGSPVTVTRVVQPGRSQFIDPRTESSLVNGAEYAVTMTAAEPIGVVANAHNDLPGSVAPMGDSYNGVPSVTGTTTYAPYVPKNTDGVARSSRVIVQNAGATAATPTVTLVPFGGGSASTVTAPSIAAGASWAFTPAVANGEHSLTVSGGTFAVLTTAISPTTAMFYTGTSTATRKLFTPNVTRSLTSGPGDPGWTTPILVQSAGATAATLRWYRFSDGSLVTTQNLTLPSGATMRVDPRSVPGLTDNTQYAVVLESPGNVVAIVTELNLLAGDNTMIYRGFAGEANVVLRSLLYDGAIPNTESDEYVEFQNVGSAAQEMSGWKISSARAAQTYTFGALTLQPGQTCRLYTNENHPEWCSLNWMASSAFWNNAGDRASLLNASGKVVSSIGFGGY